MKQIVRKALFLMICCLCSITSAWAQNRVSGQILDVLGDPLPGASVVVTGTSVGTISDMDGKFSIQANPGAQLTISFVGFTSKDVIAQDGKPMTIVLEEDNQNLDEVVVVGYGTQKKVNLTGAVASINPKEIENRPITQASQALAGLTSGVSVTQGSGRPGEDGASIRIRGIGTFSGAGSDPLVLIDGLSGSLNDVDPNNIESISVLKDAASAAIYGTRAANGVILVETKRGKAGRTQVSYNGYIGWQNATELPDFLDSWDYALMRNEANRNQGGNDTYSPEDIQKFRDGSSPDTHPNCNHMKDLVTSGSGMQTSHNVTLTKGTERLSYLLSLGYLRQEGIVDQNAYSKYNFMLNVDDQILKSLRLKANFSGYLSKADEPNTGDGDMGSMIGLSVRENATFPGRKSNGTYGYMDQYCPEGWMDSESFREKNKKQFTTGLELIWEPIKGLQFSGKFGYSYNNYYNKNFISTLVYDENKSFGPNRLTVSNGNTSLVTEQFLVRYGTAIKDHHIDVMAGTSMETFVDKWGEGYRQDFPNNLLHELDAAATAGQKSSGSATEWGLLSFFGRFNYSYKDRYLAEVDARYDGTSRFPEDGRWGLFPSVSLGWRISKEEFMQDVTWLDNLKLRASWGQLGNQNIGNYPYQNSIALGINYPFNSKNTAGAIPTTLANKNISWETTTVTDFGFDMTVLNDMFDVTFDYFDKKTDDILYHISASSILGMTPSEINAASVKNTGFEVSLRYNQKVSDLTFHVAPNFSYFKNEVTSLANGEEEDIDQGLFVGQPLGAIYGYEADGLFVDQNDVDTYAKQPYAAEPGLVRYKDISGPDGKPDGVVDSKYDRKVIGCTNPKFSFGVTLSAEWRGLDFSMLLQGLGGYEKRMTNYQAFAFYNSGNIQRWQADNRWTVENPDRDAKYPKLTSLKEGSGTILQSTYWLRNASFLRCKNLQLGYTLPKDWVKKAGLSQARFYFSGQNLFCFNSFNEGWDPEMNNSNNFYPITRIYTVGVNVKF